MAEIISPSQLAVESLDWQKMKGRIPAIFRDAEDGKILFLADTTREDVQRLLKGENPFPANPPYHDLRAGSFRILPDCDGDALLVPAYAGQCVNNCGGNAGIFYETLAMNDPQSLGDVAWGDALCTAVVAGTDRSVLGLVYTNREAVEKSMNWRKLSITDKDTVAVPAEAGEEEATRFLTLYSRSRGLWTKGLTSGQYFTVVDIRRTGRAYREAFGQDALLYVVSHAPATGFCHEKQSDFRLPAEGYFRSCFHRTLSL